MTALSLVPSSRALLTATVKQDDGTVVSHLCDLKGNRLPLGDPGLPIYRDTYTAKTFVRVAEVIPSATDPISKAAAAEITALNPTHYASPDGDVKGYFIEAPDFNEREGKL